MRDGVGAVQSVLVLGGGSEIARAIVDRLVAARCRTVVLGVRDPARVASTVDRLRSAEAARANYVGSVSAGLVVADRFRTQGHGTLLVLSSVAGVRARADNYVYGSTKAGLDAFAQGLGDALIGTGARVVIVRPGFVHTKMTEGMPPAPFSTTPDAVADAVVAGLAKGREVIWAPTIVGPVFAVLRLLPRPVWRKVSAR